MHIVYSIYSHAVMLQYHNLCCRNLPWLMPPKFETLIPSVVSSSYFLPPLPDENNIKWFYEIPPKCSPPRAYCEIYAFHSVGPA